MLEEGPCDLSKQDRIFYSNFGLFYSEFLLSVQFHFVGIFKKLFVKISLRQCSYFVHIIIGALHIFLVDCDDDL